MKVFKKTYHLFILPVILLGLAYLLLVCNIENGDVISSILQPWGASIILMIVSQIYLESIFTSPRYALVNALNALVVGVIIYKEQQDINNFWIISIYSLLVFLSSILFFLFYEKQKKINFFTKFSEIFGSATVIFPILVIIQFAKIEISSTTFNISFISEPLIFLLVYYLLFK